MCTHNKERLNKLYIILPLEPKKSNPEVINMHHAKQTMRMINIIKLFIFVAHDEPISEDSI